MDRYRFRTKSEFLYEFGSNWENEINVGWCDGMNYLFNTEIPSKAIQSLIHDCYACVDGWDISWDMVIEITSKTNLKINKNDYVGKIIKVSRPTPKVRRGEKPRGSVCTGRTEAVRVEIGYLSHEAITSSC